jgi:hypothetical protein
MLQRTKTVFILGAGTSVHCHVPVMKDFLDEAYRLRRHTQVDLDREAFDLVFEAITVLNAVYAKSSLELRNVESVFAAFEMAALFGRLGELGADRIRGLVPALKKVIIETIEATQLFRVAPQVFQESTGMVLKKHIAPSAEYEAFADLIKDLAVAGHDVAVLTFNYDVGVDFALQQQPLSYASALEEDPENVRVELLKLHGSLNWAQCPQCKKVSIKPLRTVPPVAEMGEYSASLRPSRGIREIHCPGNEREEPFIVPPTWSKSEHYSAISPVWRRAAQRLGEAENIFIIGYSLPDTDHFFRYLYALGTMGPSRVERLYVFNPDRTTDQRYQQLLGPIAKERYCLNPEHGRDANPGTFGSAIRFLDAEFSTVTQ